MTERRLSPRAKTRSLAARLTRVNLLVSGIILLLAALAFFTFDLISFRQNLIAHMDAEAQIVGDNAVSAMLFNDRESAEKTLASLHYAPDVTGAVLRARDESLFAKYGAVSPPTKGAVHKLAPGEMDHWWPATNSRVLVAHRIVFEGNTVGTAYVVGSLAEIHRRALRYSLIAGLILLLCLGASVPISSLSHRLIATPIRKLADTALAVSREQDYSVRAEAETGSSELAILVSAFNVMLTQIQERDAALIDARNRLEQRVEERTAELQNANRELEAFSYTVAHDLRGPLDAVSGIVYLLSSRPDAGMDEASRAMLAQLKSSTDNMAVLIDDLLHFARASTTPIRKTPVNISALAREIVVELHASAPERDVHFVVAELPTVEADEGLVRIVLDNLLRNAWKYTSHHDAALIEFGGKPVGDRLVYFVRDDGAGFDAKHKDALFEPFQRLHSKSEFPGTGIGLATVQRILARLGGRIWAEGAVEVGAAFYFTLGEAES